jgi:hypothetical protein
MSLMDTILAKLADVADQVNKRRVFDRYKAALTTARASGEQADIDAARQLESELNGLLDQPATSADWASVKATLFSTSTAS